MNIICDKTLLSAAIDGVSKAVTLRSTIPVLEGILLKAEGFQLTLTGYDLEMGIVTTIEANVKEPGEIVLNAKLLSSMISRMPAGQITIQSADNGKTTIQSGVAQFEIQSMSATDFPELPNTGAEETLTIKTGVLRDMIDRTLYAVSQDVMGATPGDNDQDPPEVIDAEQAHQTTHLSWISSLTGQKSWSSILDAINANPSLNTACPTVYAGCQ